MAPQQVSCSRGCRGWTGGQVGYSHPILNNLMIDVTPLAGPEKRVNSSKTFGAVRPVTRLAGREGILSGVTDAAIQKVTLWLLDRVREWGSEHPLASCWKTLTSMKPRKLRNDENDCFHLIEWWKGGNERNNPGNWSLTAQIDSCQNRLMGTKIMMGRKVWEEKKKGTRKNKQVSENSEMPRWGYEQSVPSKTDLCTLARNKGKVQRINVFGLGEDPIFSKASQWAGRTGIRQGSRNK